ncbi:Fic family protein [Pseudomonas vanderleydeniana]|uniref:Fic family protein n=1 Tax=Pseudomonas vanderleydeniana TaxID=2745495 RepID=A0A9E6PS16_9PSED|nr:Fic family protein [Pseudomonas vanderleydeniana]QXI31639.1 Fic family protein [Pseudomonas vanderleydeniana]
MIKAPPAAVDSPFTTIIKKHLEMVEDYLELAQAVDIKGRYQHFDELRFRWPKGVDSQLAWAVVKAERQKQQRNVLSLDDPARPCPLFYTPAMHIAISACDQNTTTAALEWMCSRIGEEKHLQYLLNDLIEDEAISSSQLEGAATTTKAAKELLKRQRGPRTPDEKMIISNYKLMKLAWECRNRELSLELITELHQTGVEGIDDEHYHPGALRNDDNIVIEDGRGNVAHQPPPAYNLAARLRLICEWINTHHSDMNDLNYIHPLVKAIILHFAVGFEHPFHDGNDRVARSLFYWYLFKRGFGAFRYIAISTLLKAAPIQYGKSYLYTETDDMDLTYFVDYQCRVITRAIGEFRKTYEATVESMTRFNTFLYESGLYSKLSEKQRVVFNVAKSGTAQQFTVTGVKDNFGCAYNTAAAVLNGLVDLNLFRKSKVGNEWMYEMIDATSIQKNWKA